MIVFKSTLSSVLNDQMTSDTSTVTPVTTSEVFNTPPPADGFAVIGCRLPRERILKVPAQSSAPLEAWMSS